MNFREWRAHVLSRLTQQIDSSGDPGLIMLLDELTSYPVPPGARPHPLGEPSALGGIAVPLELALEVGTLRFLSTTTVFGSALDVTLSEFAIESFFPADEETAALIRRLLQPQADAVG